MDSLDHPNHALGRMELGLSVNYAFAEDKWKIFSLMIDDSCSCVSARSLLFMSRNFCCPQLEVVHCVNY